ncbi:glycosyltransferase, partial [Paenibacillus sepulcri]|nr:glycosyltransferase [Paenibacillus sepulcri]
AHLNLCTSQSVLDELTAKGFRSVQLWKRGVSSDEFGPDHRNHDMRDLLSNGQPGKTILLYVGRLAAEKEIERIREVLESSPRYCLALVGDGPHRASLEAYFQGTNTTFTGFMHGEQLSQAYASSDMFIFPSTTETLGLVILEAMASGLPVIAGISGPTCEQIEDGVTGLLYDTGRPGGLTEAVSRAADPELRERISGSASNAARRFGWSEPSAQLLNYYQHVLKEQKETAGGAGRRELADEDA